MGVCFRSFEGCWGAKIKKLIEKKSKLSYKLKLIVANLFLKVIFTLYSCIKRIKTVGNLIQGSLKDSKRIKTGEFSMKSTEISEFYQLCKYPQ